MGIIFKIIVGVLASIGLLAVGSKLLKKYYENLAEVDTEFDIDEFDENDYDEEPEYTTEPTEE